MLFWTIPLIRAFGVGGSECLVVFCPDLIERISANIVVPPSLALEMYDYCYTIVLIGVVFLKAS
jgi:hypothetical protein